MNYTDHLNIQQLELQTIIGVHPFERQRPQKLRLDLKLGLKTANCIQSDAIEDTLNYDGLITAIIETASQTRFQLIESFADHIATMIKSQFAVESVELTLHKPSAHPKANISIHLCR